MRVFVLGSSGMIGSAIFRYLNSSRDVQCFPLVRSNRKARLLPEINNNLLLYGDLEDTSLLCNHIVKQKPNVLINCVGITKHLKEGANPIKSIKMNSLFPHVIASCCSDNNVQFIQISTDCVFSGKKGNYTESEVPDANDIYGKSKYLGEINYNNHLTIRTSTIGHELETKNGLLEWFLSQNKCQGYQNAIFSGFTTLELAKIIFKIIFLTNKISGLYHLSSDPIDKFSLLTLISSVYNHNATITKDAELIIDRSLNSDKFSQDVRYQAPSWEDMISNMYTDSLI